MKLIQKEYYSFEEMKTIDNILDDFRVNCYDAITPQTPFGGYKKSGIGREL